MSPHLASWLFLRTPSAQSSRCSLAPSHPRSPPPRWAGSTGLEGPCRSRQAASGLLFKPHQAPPLSDGAGGIHPLSTAPGAGGIHPPLQLISTAPPRGEVVGRPPAPCPGAPSLAGEPQNSPCAVRLLGKPLFVFPVRKQEASRRQVGRGGCSQQQRPDRSRAPGRKEESPDQALQQLGVQNRSQKSTRELLHRFYLSND